MDHIATWVPAAAFLVSTATIFWKSGAVIAKLETLLSELTKDVVEIKAEVKELRAIHTKPSRSRRK